MAKAAGYGLGFACFALVATMASATQFQVGGNNGWSVAGASAQSYNTWAMKNRFKIGDTLVFVYPKDTDSVLVVQPADYNACNTSSYDKKFADGNTVFTLDRAGAFFFISGVDANCRANEKLIVMVLAGRNGNSSGGASPSSPVAPPPASSAPSASSPPPAASPAPSASSPPPATVSPPAPAPKVPSATSAPPPASVSAPVTPPSSAPAASSPPSAPPSSSPPSTTPSAPAGAPPMPPPATAPAGADGGSTNTTGASPPTGSTNQNSAGFMVTGAAASAAACIVGYAMLAV
ncbi:uncharacterized protein [Lolium perenne]|uniref:uncharacterized protein n=1 Tax=Lolium perenne TaxID=4522 RepID=UPI0021EAC676|nr:classical arabinogalactan protein 9-like [Lolium perenne]